MIKIVTEPESTGHPDVHYSETKHHCTPRPSAPMGPKGACLPGVKPRGTREQCTAKPPAST